MTAALVSMVRKDHVSREIICAPKSTILIKTVVIGFKRVRDDKMIPIAQPFGGIYDRIEGDVR